MNTILWVFIAFAFGLMMFVGIQPHIPDELGFLKSKPSATTTQTGASVSQYQGWTIRQQGTAVEVTRPLTGQIEVNGTAYDTPEIGILCDNGKLDLRLDTRLPTTGIKTTTVSVAGMGNAEWDKSQTKNIFPKEPARVLAALKAGSPVEFKVSYAAIGVQKSYLDTSALPQLLSVFPETCR